MLTHWYQCPKKKCHYFCTGVYNKAIWLGIFVTSTDDNALSHFADTTPYRHDDHYDQKYWRRQFRQDSQHDNILGRWSLWRITYINTSSSMCGQLHWLLWFFLCSTSCCSASSQPPEGLLRVSKSIWLSTGHVHRPCSRSRRQFLIVHSHVGLTFSNCRGTADPGGEADIFAITS